MASPFRSVAHPGVIASPPSANTADSATARLKSRIEISLLSDFSTQTMRKDRASLLSG
jgi:hypothetical protein